MNDTGSGIRQPGSRSGKYGRCPCCNRRGCYVEGGHWSSGQWIPARLRCRYCHAERVLPDSPSEWTSAISGALTDAGTWQ